jgi:hypothetical protein
MPNKTKMVVNPQQCNAPLTKHNQPSPALVALQLLRQFVGQLLLANPNRKGAIGRTAM